MPTYKISLTGILGIDRNPKQNIWSPMIHYDGQDQQVLGSYETLDRKFCKLGVENSGT